jgi:Zn finger protein HypA/HybF involved in hydrogenase expression
MHKGDATMNCPDCNKPMYQAKDAWICTECGARITGEPVLVTDSDCPAEYRRSTPDVKMTNQRLEEMENPHHLMLGTDIPCQKMNPEHLVPVSAQPRLMAVFERPLSDHHREIIRNCIEDMVASGRPLVIDSIMTLYQLVDGRWSRIHPPDPVPSHRLVGGKWEKNPEYPTESPVYRAAIAAITSKGEFTTVDVQIRDESGKILDGLVDSAGAVEAFVSFRGIPAVAANCGFSCANCRRQFNGNPRDGLCGDCHGKRHGFPIRHLATRKDLEPLERTGTGEATVVSREIPTEYPDYQTLTIAFPPEFHGFSKQLRAGTKLMIRLHEGDRELQD